MNVRLFEKSRQQGKTVEQLRDLVARHKDLRETIDLAIAELEKGRPAVAANILRGARLADRRRRR